MRLLHVECAKTVDFNTEHVLDAWVLRWGFAAMPGQRFMAKDSQARPARLSLFLAQMAIVGEQPLAAARSTVIRAIPQSSL